MKLRIYPCPTLFHLDAAGKAFDSARIDPFETILNTREDIRMKPKTIILLISAVILLPGLAGAVSEKDLKAQTTENIINLCTAAPDDPLYHQAINFCHG